MKKAFQKLSLIFLLIGLVGCQPSDSSSIDSSIFEAIGVDSSLELEGEIGLIWADQTGNPHWLVTSESQGLLLISANGESTVLRSSAELLDIRNDIKLGNELLSLGISFDQNKGELFLFGLNKKNQSFKELGTLETGSLEAEGICLQKTLNGNVFAFVLDGKGHALHYLLVDGARNRIAPTRIRTLNVAPGSIACSVDDVTKRLYILEEDLGIWSYAASPEVELDRKPFQLVKPYGSHLAAIKGIYVRHGILATIDTDNKQIKLFNLAKLSLLAIIDIKEYPEPEAITSSKGADGSLYLIIYDANQDQYLHAQLNLDFPDQTPAQTMPEIPAVVQTTPMNRSGDVADDPAIWVNPMNPQQSRILGTNKKSGLHVYDMQGNELQYFATGRLNNVDLRSGFKAAQSQLSFVAASNRNDNSIAMFTIDEQGVVDHTNNIATELSEVYGLCTHKSKAGEFFVFVNDKDGRFQQWLVEFDEVSKTFSGKNMRSFKTDSQPEGCVANDKSDRIFVGEEDVGVWVTSAAPDGGSVLQPVVKVNALDSASHVVDDVEGLAIYYGKKKDYLVLSSQGNDSYVILDTVPPYQYRGKFRIGMNIVAGIDGASETDGLEIVSANLPNEFSEGMLVVQDGRNVMPQAGQNFKYIPWKSIRRTLHLQP